MTTAADSDSLSPVGVQRYFDALKKIPRRDFLADAALAPGMVVGRSIPSPRALSKLLQALDPKPEDRALHVGAGVGYATGVISQLVAEVDCFERFEPLGHAAQMHLRKLGIENVSLHIGDGLSGLAERAPFDCILVSCHLEDSVEPLLRQLAPGGRLVLTDGRDRLEQTVVRYVESNGSAEREELGSISFNSDLGELLVGMGLVEGRQVEQARQAAQRSHRSFEDEIQRSAMLEDVDFYRALALQNGMAFATANELRGDLDKNFFERFPRAFLEHAHIVPICETERALVFATCEVAAEAKNLSLGTVGKSTVLKLVTPTDLRRLWATLDLGLARGVGVAEGVRRHRDVVDLLNKESDKLEAESVALFDALALDAIGERASDLHLERYRDKVVIRLRIDGELHELSRYQLSAEQLVGLVNVVKIKAGLDISERRLPQGGRARLRAGEAVYDLRVQTQPGLHGENVTIRLLPQAAQLLSIEDLGFPPEVAGHYRRLLSNPQGLVLVVGPTGSGKSTTLYAGLQVLASDQTRKVITIEDPVEYEMPGVQQTQVKRDIGFDFAGAMRSFVRQDPDVILVGEIRDRETALEAIRASQTGHLVLSTLHSNDSVDAVQRLFDLDMHANSISGELLAVISQRLAKRICRHCRVEDSPDEALLDEVFPAGVKDGFRFFRGAGCKQCQGRGTRGRVAVVELLRTPPAVRSVISRRPPVDELRAVAIEAGLISLRDTALWHVQEGNIALHELPRILPEEKLAAQDPRQILDELEQPGGRKSGRRARLSFSDWEKGVLALEPPEVAAPAASEKSGQE